MSMTPDRARLRWRCRRGMKELDVLLSGFLENRYDALTEEQKHGFAALLDCEDPDLYAWMVGQQAAPTAELRNVIEFIRG
jgi:antitoxin CptB